VLVPTAEDCSAGRSLGFSPGEERFLSRGLNESTDAPVRECAHFRWDQSVLNARLFAAFPDAELADLASHAGWQTPRDHPQQLIWHHRRRGPLRYVGRAPYDPAIRRQARASARRLRARWWLKLNQRYFQRTTYRLKLARIARQLRGRD
jgi:hypothetical protein